MAVLNVPGMKCEKCVARITKALGDEGLAFSVDLATKTVSIEDDSALDKAIGALDDIGFEAAKA